MTMARMMMQVIIHPYDFFHDIQEPKSIRWHYGIIVVLLAYMARMISIMLTGYTYQVREAHQISTLHEFIWLVVPWMTWCVSNWAVSTILDGEGKFKEIFHGSAFALVPYVIFIIPITLLTNVLSLDESSIFAFLLYCVYGWCAWLVFLKVKIVHDFELGKIVFIIFLSIVGIGIIWFVGILLFGLSNQFVNFFIDLFKEFRLRA